MGPHHKLAGQLPPPSDSVVTLQDVGERHFDYVIVGGGTSGCLLANRLAAAPRQPALSVLLVGELVCFVLLAAVAVVRRWLALWLWYCCFLRLRA